jgi:hypothetical protein
MATIIDYGDEVDFDGTLTPPVALSSNSIGSVQRVFTLSDDPSASQITKLVELGK